MKRRLVRYKKDAFLLLCVCIAALMLHNELTQQYNIKYPILRHTRTLLISTESKETFRPSHSNDHHVISNYNDVIRNTSLSETNKNSADGTILSDNTFILNNESLRETKSQFTNGTSFSEYAFEQWNQINRKKLAIFIFSAVASDIVEKDKPPVIVLNGWEAKRSKRAPIKCCFTWTNRRTSFVTSPNKTYNNNKKKPIVLFALQVYCPVYGNIHDVTGVTLEYTRNRCPDPNKTVYVKPTIARKPDNNNNSLAVCGKIFYGGVDEKLIVDWVEYYRLMKVDKIVLFTHNLTRRAEAVIQYYASTGYVEVGKFDIPLKTGTREVGTKNPEAWNDEEVAVFDCFERLKGYTYFLIVDLDEFLLPRNHTDMKAMISHLRKQRPKAAGFTFKSQLYLKEWGKTEVNNGSDIVQYFERTDVVYTRQKSVVMPDRVIQGSIHTHTYKAMDGYLRIIADANIGIMNHYRYSCYENYLHKCTKARRRTDRGIMKFVRKISKRTSEVLQHIT